MLLITSDYEVKKLSFKSSLVQPIHDGKVVYYYNFRMKEMMHKGVQGEHERM